MRFKLPKYIAPDWANDLFVNAPNALLRPAPQDSVAPEQYHATSIFPEYFKIDGVWLLAKDSRMDCVAVYREKQVEILEFRKLKAGDLVVVGRTEDASEGIYVHTQGFESMQENAQAFAFRQSRSRETAYSRDYDTLYELLHYERAHGNILWVMGPACAFDADSRAAFAALVRGGYVHGLLAGNALATHDLEAAYLHTALGQDIYTQETRPNGHYNHIDTINAVRRCGSIAAFVEQKNACDGIFYECVRKQIPFALTGSIRDDGPLPEVYADVYAGQDAMRALVRKATTVICVATTLHSIATGNMTPSYRVTDGQVRPLYFYAVDISEFAVNKLRDRGSLAVKTFVTNVQDFIVNISKGVCQGKTPKTDAF